MSKRGQEHGSRTGKGLHSSWREAGGTGDLSACSQRMGAPEARQLPATVPWLLGSVRSAVGEELGLVWGGGVCTLRLFIQFEEHLLLPLLLVQIFLQSLEGRWSSARSHRTQDSHQSVLRKLPSQAPVLGPLDLPSLLFHSLPPTSSSLLSRPLRVSGGHGEQMRICWQENRQRPKMERGLTAGGADTSKLQVPAQGLSLRTLPEPSPGYTCCHAAPEMLSVNTSGRTGVLCAVNAHEIPERSSLSR